MPDGLYDHDALAWADQQAALLRQLAAGKRPDTPIDWANVIEEVQDVGLSQLRSCRSLLRQALLHLMKQQAWPDSPAAAHWASEAVGFLLDAQDAFSPAMRQRISLDELYAKALHQARLMANDAGQPRPLPDACPFVLDDLLVERPDAAALAVKLAVAAEPKESRLC